MVKYSCDRCGTTTIHREALKTFIVAAGTGATARQWTRKYCTYCFDVVRLAVECIVTETVETESNGDLFVDPEEKKRFSEWKVPKKIEKRS